ncbi:MAG: AAA family ATPase [Candidatus Nealsonbacteria bacterium]|nr:AAA family ATPase [Candidatus Nealsonbacteria bacterium]
MLEHLNKRTRDAVLRLASGKDLSIGGERQSPLTDGVERSSLCIVAEHLNDLREKKGDELTGRVVKLMGEHEPWELDDLSESEPDRLSRTPWRLGKVRACSFRGLAPADETWEHDFAGKSHLMYGPNGCGKSSLLGALAWCLTGKLFRDDRTPSAPTEEPVYSTDKKSKAIRKHADALTLLDAEGNSVKAEATYWVELQFQAEDESGDDQELWIRRDSADGIAQSADGTSWASVSDLGETGIDELDAELHVLLPAKIPHLHFGENPDLVRLFSQIIGLDDLADIADVAGRAGTALRTLATKKEKDELRRHDKAIAERDAEIEEAATDGLTAWPSYRSAMQTARSLEDIERLGKELGKKIEEWKAQLVGDIGLEIPEKDTPEFEEFRRKVDELSGRVQSALDHLGRPLSTLFPTSVWEEVPSEEGTETNAKALAAFEEDARRQIRERLDWEARRRKEPKIALLLEAIQHFPEGSNECPVCTQDLEPVPDMKDRIEELRPYITHEHLKKKIGDLRDSLLARLEGIVPAEQRNKGKTAIAERLRKDWQNLKASRFMGLLRTIADKYDAAIEQAACKLEAESVAEDSLAPDTTDPLLRKEFSALDEQFHLAQEYIQLCRLMRQHSQCLTDSLTSTLTARKSTEPVSLLFLLERGKTATEQLQSLETIRKSARGLWKAQKDRAVVNGLITHYRALADATAVCKALGKLVRAETMKIVGGVEPRMEEHFKTLYDDELLPFDKLTPGHAANPNVKNQLSLYLRAGDGRVPAGPFCNAGRLRALALSFVFALLEQSKGTLASLILDDPAISLDDDHMARFVDGLVDPCMEQRQVILATHYYEFYNRAEPVFSGAERLQLPPRRTAADAVSFEPADLLNRVESAVEEGGTNWLEMAINLRKWAERTLGTISGYCPEPFVVFNNFPATVANYKNITDPRIATNNRDAIVRAFTNPKFERVRNSPAHGSASPPSLTEVEDGLKVLTECRNAANTEIVRFKTLYRHRQLARALPVRPTSQPLSLKSVLRDTSLNVVAAAAAASGGTGIDATESTEIRLDGCQLALIKEDILEPIALRGQYVLLDADGNPPSDEDLVLVETEEGKRYARRFWNSEKGPYLEGINQTSCFPPVQIEPGLYKVRRIVGVLFDGPGANVSGGSDEEWSPASVDTTAIISKLKGVRVRKTSMEPLARDGQVVLIHQEDARAELFAGDLACVNAEDIDNLIKRCYPGKERWILCPVNPTIVEDPICVDTDKIRQAYRLAGVLFEPDS